MRLPTPLFATVGAALLLAGCATAPPASAPADVPAPKAAAPAAS